MFGCSCYFFFWNKQQLFFGKLSSPLLCFTNDKIVQL
jgi:hypothetical protein